MTPAAAPASPAPANRGWTRRRWLGASLAGLGLAGCDRLSKLSFNRAVAINGEIHALVWDNYFSPEIFAEFERRAGIRTRVHIFSSNDELPDLLTARKFPYDLAMPSAFMAKELLDRGLLKDFNHANLPLLGELDQKTYNPRFDPKNSFALPYIWGSTGIGYNARRVEGLPKSWADLFRHRAPSRSAEPEEGKISVINDARFTIGSVLIYLGFSPSTNNVAEIERAGEVLMRLRDQITHFESDNVAQLLATEQVELAMAWSGDVTRAMKGDAVRNIPANKKVRISLPHEGSIMFTDNFVIPRAAENQKNAEAFVNYLLDPEVAAAVTNYSLYATTVPDARAYVDRMIVNGPAYFRHPSGTQRNFLLEDSGADETYRRVWAKIKDRTASSTPAGVGIPSMPQATPMPAAKSAKGA